MKSRIIRGMTKDRNVRFLAADTTELVETARQIHNTLPTSTDAFGRVLTGASLLGKFLKGDDERVTLQIKGDNHIKTILCISNNEGVVKGYISNPNVNIDSKDSGNLNVGEAIGNGEIIVMKDFGLKDQFVGRVELVNGEIAEDLAAYFMYSEQQPSIVALGVFINEDGSVRHAGGLIIQPMPYAEEDIIDSLEKLAKEIIPITSSLSKGLSLEDIVADSLKGFEIEVLDENDIEFKCDCSHERIESAVMSIGKADLEQIIKEDGKAEVQCHFCNKKYNFNKDELTKLLALIDNQE